MIRLLTIIMFTWFNTNAQSYFFRTAGGKHYLQYVNAASTYLDSLIIVKELDYVRFKTDDFYAKCWTPTIAGINILQTINGHVTPFPIGSIPVASLSGISNYALASTIPTVSLNYGIVNSGTSLNMNLDSDTSSVNGLMSKQRAAATVSVLTSSINGKEPSISTGTTTQYWRGDKTWQTLPTQTLQSIPDCSITATGATVTSAGTNSFNIDVPAQITPTVTGQGIATATSSGYGYTVAVQSPTFTGSNIAISGTWPSMTFSNTAPRVTQTITSGSGIIVSTSTSTPNTFTVALSKRTEIGTATTSTAGVVSFTYANTYTVVPNVQYNLGLGAGNKETIIPQTATTTGCSFLVQLRADVLGLLPSYSAVSGREVNISVIEK